VPRGVSKVEKLIPRLAEGFRELVEDLPNAVRRDVDRARATVRQYVGDKILVADEVPDGQQVVAFRTEKRPHGSGLSALGWRLGRPPDKCGNGGRRRSHKTLIALVGDSL
jgi:hypothetical protein